nr:hypothetical protein [uncultured Carboxylicivirga sp.]
MKKKFSILILIIFAWLNSFGQIDNKLQGIWLGETFDNYIVLLDFKKNGELNIGHINNNQGPLKIETDYGSWRLNQNHLDLKINNSSISLEILESYKDSIIFNAQQTNDIQIKKLILTFSGQEQQIIDIKSLLANNIYKDKFGNTYDLNKNWIILNFNNLCFITNEYCWFSSRIIYQFRQLQEKNIQFEFYYKDNICDFELFRSNK